MVPNGRRDPSVPIRAVQSSRVWIPPSFRASTRHQETRRRARVSKSCAGRHTGQGGGTQGQVRFLAGAVTFFGTCHRSALSNRTSDVFKRDVERSSCASESRLSKPPHRRPRSTAMTGVAPHAVRHGGPRPGLPGVSRPTERPLSSTLYPTSRTGTCFGCGGVTTTRHPHSEGPEPAHEADVAPGQSSPGALGNLTHPNRFPELHLQRLHRSMRSMVPSACRANRPASRPCTGSSDCQGQPPNRVR
jgi:hypothetical protein